MSTLGRVQVFFPTFFAPPLIRGAVSAPDPPECPYAVAFILEPADDETDASTDF